MTEEEKAAMRKQMEEEIRAQLEANAAAMMSWDDKLQASRKEIVETSEEDTKVPFLSNVNEDSMLTGKVKYKLKEGITRIGKKDGSPDIPMNGLGMATEHAIITMKDGDITLKPGSPGAKTKVNGLALTDELKLKHHDRIVFGSSHHWYFFVNPNDQEMNEGSPAEVDWDFMNKEIAQSKGFASDAKGMSKDQILAQEQVLELLPMVGEANAVSEELDKKMAFEVVLISGAAQGGGGDKGGTKVSVKMKNLINENIWLWDRGKFTNRRFLMQDLYQRWLDGEDISKVPKEEDPFWEPPEDVLVGTANVFLQSLAYALDFNDKLAITDYKGSEEGSAVIEVAPCSQDGKPLDEDYFVENPKELIGKPYHFMVKVINAEVQKARYCHGLYMKYTSFGEENPTLTEVKVDTLSPVFNHSKIYSFPAVSEDHLNWFETGSLSFSLYAKQNDQIVDARLAKLTTKELRAKDTIQTKKADKKNATFRENNAGIISQLKSELILYKTRYNRAIEKEKRIKDVVEEWGKKNDSEKNFDAFHRAVHAAAFHERGKLKYKVNLLQSYLKNQPDTVANGGKIKTDDIKVPAGSKACSIM